MLYNYVERIQAFMDNVQDDYQKYKSKKLLLSGYYLKSTDV